MILSLTDKNLSEREEADNPKYALFVQSTHTSI